MNEMITNYTTKEKLDLNIKDQKRMNIISINKLSKSGVEKNKFEAVDFYFYSDRSNKLVLLGDELSLLSYDLDEIEESSEEGAFLLPGTVPSLQINLETLDKWVEQMCKLGFKYDCDFSGWETAL